MTSVRARITGEIELNVDEVPQQALEQIKSALTFVNEDREKQKSMNIFGWWDLPEVITLYRFERRRSGEHVILLPRGFAYQLLLGMGQAGIELVWDDQRVSVPASPGYFKPFVLRDYQLEAAKHLLSSQQGFYEAPAGSGKTTTALGVSAWAQQRTLVVVDKAGLLEQWRTRASTFLNLSLDLSESLAVGKIGEDVWEERDLTIALRQTLWSREWENKATRWWDTWALVWFDEGHHLGAETLGELARQVRAKWMFAISATPAKSPTHGAVVHALVGPIVARTTRQELYDRGVLMRPQVEQIETGFETPFWGDHESDSSGNCEAEGCKKRGKHRHRNNYSSALKKLVEDKQRNKLIAERIVRDRGHVHLVPSRQLKHLDLLKQACCDAGWDGPIFFLRGEENARGESQDIVREIEMSHEAIIFSTVANEGLDIPPIDRVHIVFPMRQEAATIQLVGRGERVAEGKEESIILDYVDSSVPFSDQALDRHMVYGAVGYEILKPSHA